MMHFSIFYSVFGLLINTIIIPFDRGANIPGSSRAPQVINKNLNFNNIVNNYTVDCDNKNIRSIFEEGYFRTWKTLNNNIFPLVIGGDHTISVASISAVNDYCVSQKCSLGVLWIDAHADINTYDKSKSKNYHGMPLAFLTGLEDTKINTFNINLPFKDILYIGIRDLDNYEKEIIDKYNIKYITCDSNFNTIKDTILDFVKDSKVHISFDIDSLDKKYFKSCNTLVDNGLDIFKTRYIFDVLKKYCKINSMDITEINFMKCSPKEIYKDYEILKYITNELNLFK